jgi:hypothetical protein
MNKEILRDILKLKLEIADHIVGKLPEPMGERLRDMQHELLSVIGEVVEDMKEKLEKRDQGDDAKKVKPIAVE